MRQIASRDIAGFAVSISAAAITYIVVSRAPLADAAAMPVKPPPSPQIACIDTPEKFQVRSTPVSLEHKTAGVQLNLDTAVQNDLETPLAVTVAYALWDDTGNSVEVGPHSAADAQAIPAGGSKSFASSVPAGLKPGYYRLQAVAVGVDAAGKSHTTENSSYVQVVNGEIQPMTSAEWRAVSRYNIGRVDSDPATPVESEGGLTAPGAAKGGIK